MLIFSIVALLFSFLLYRVHLVLAPLTSVEQLDPVPSDCSFVDILDISGDGGGFPVAGTEDAEVVNDRYMITSNL